MDFLYVYDYISKELGWRQIQKLARDTMKCEIRNQKVIALM